MFELAPPARTERIDDPTGGHRYLVAGRPVPSVTQVLKLRNLMPRYNDAAPGNGEDPMLRGRLVHQAIHFLNCGDLDESSVDPALAGYVDAYRSFRKDWVQHILWSEVAWGSPTFGFAGTLDLVCRFNGRIPDSIIDFKTGAYDKWMALQLAAYEMLAEPYLIGNVNPKLESHTVLLRPTGTYQVHSGEDYQNTNRCLFMQALALTHWKGDWRK